MTSDQAHTQTLALCRQILHEGRVAMLPATLRKQALTMHTQFLFLLHPQLRNWRYLADCFQMELEQQVHVEPGHLIITHHVLYEHAEAAGRFEYANDHASTDFEASMVRTVARLEGRGGARSMLYMALRKRAETSHNAVFGKEVDPAIFNLLVSVDHVYTGLLLLCEPEFLDDELIVISKQALGDRFIPILQQRVESVLWLLDTYPSFRNGLTESMVPTAD